MKENMKKIAIKQKENQKIMEKQRKFTKHRHKETNRKSILKIIRKFAYTKKKQKNLKFTKQDHQDIRKNRKKSNIQLKAEYSHKKNIRKFTYTQKKKIYIKSLNQISRQNSKRQQKGNRE